MTARKELLENIRQYPGDEGSDQNNFRKTMNSIQKRVNYLLFVGITWNSRIFCLASLLWYRSISRLVQCWCMDWATICTRFMLYWREKWLWKTNCCKWNLWFNLHGWMFQYDSNGNQSKFNDCWYFSLRTCFCWSKLIGILRWEKLLMIFFLGLLYCCCTWSTLLFTTTWPLYLKIFDKSLTLVQTTLILFR